LSRQKATAIGVILLGLAASVAGILAWSDRTGCLSRGNYERVTKGMELSQVELLLGGPGEEIPPEQVPTVPSWARFADAPEGWPGVVWGERYFRWETGSRTIHIGVQDGKVVSKWYWEPSL
jgi:hypothetical protein